MRYTLFLCVDFNHTYLDHHILLILAPHLITAGVTPFKVHVGQHKILGMDSTGRAMLVDGMQVSEYANPQALFILNEI